MISFTHPTTPAPSSQCRRLTIPVLLWIRLVWQLRRRGHGRRESGAFLLGIRDTGQDSRCKDKVKQFVCYDDLDPHALDTGVVTFAPTGYAALWSLCRRHRLDVLADVHTHPGGHPQQSGTDCANPMISEAGHVAIILPWFARCWGWKLKNVGVYEYLGNYEWRDWSARDRRDRVRFRWL